MNSTDIVLEICKRGHDVKILKDGEKTWRVLVEGQYRDSLVSGNFYGQNLEKIFKNIYSKFLEGKEKLELKNKEMKEIEDYCLKNHIGK